MKDGGTAISTAAESASLDVIVCWLLHHKLFFEHFTVATVIVEHLTVHVTWLEYSFDALFFILSGPYWVENESGDHWDECSCS